MPFRFPFNSPFNFPFSAKSYMYNSSRELKFANTSQRAFPNQMVSTSSNPIQDSNFETIHQKSQKNIHTSNNDLRHNINDNCSSRFILNDINCSTKKASEANASEAFFEIFGLKIYFDDILIMCILFFLYTEDVHNDELFICLILLLLS